MSGEKAVALSTNDSELKDMAEKYIRDGLDIFDRPEELAKEGDGAIKLKDMNSAIRSYHGEQVQWDEMKMIRLMGNSLILNDDVIDLMDKALDYCEGDFEVMTARVAEKDHPYYAVVRDEEGRWNWREEGMKANCSRSTDFPNIMMDSGAGYGTVYPSNGMRNYVVVETGKYDVFHVHDEKDAIVADAAWRAFRC